MPKGIYERTKECNNAHKVHQNKKCYVMKEKQKLSLKVPKSEKGKKNIKDSHNTTEYKEKQRQIRIEYMKTHKGNFRDTDIEKQLHKMLLMIFKKDEIVSQFYIKDVVIVDFYIPKVNLILEADSVYYHTKPGRQERDKIRAEKMKALGYKVLRFWDYELKDIENCTNKIKEFI